MTGSPPTFRRRRRHERRPVAAYSTGLRARSGHEFRAMSPWVLKSPSQFRPYGPPPMGSVQYVNDFNETKIMGSGSAQ